MTDTLDRADSPERLNLTLRPTRPPLSVGARQRPTSSAQVEIVIPVYNEEADLADSVHRLYDDLTARFPVPWLVTIVDNASTDATWGAACRLVSELDGVSAIHLDQKGRGRALRQAWMTSTAPVVAYMDVDLSTDLNALLPLVAPLLSGHSDIAIGTRLARDSAADRGPRREFISRSYNLLLRAALRIGFSDAQCGFKAMRTDVARDLLPLVADEEWFFDTEMLVLGERNGLRVHEVPVDWVDDPGSTVHVTHTALADLRGMARLMIDMVRGGSPRLERSGTVGSPTGMSGSTRPELPGQLVRFASIGVVSTALFAVLFTLLRPALGSFGADVVALSVCFVVNTAANRRLTFALRGRTARIRHYSAALVLAAFPLAANLVTLAVMELLGLTSTIWLVAALTVVNGAAGLGRFLALRRWVFQPESSEKLAEAGRADHPET